MFKYSSHEKSINLNKYILESLLFKYRRNNSPVFHCSNSDYHFSISRQILKNYADVNIQDFHPEKGVFYLTSTVLCESNYAQDKLAITYSPTNAFLFLPDGTDTFLNNLGQSVSLSSKNALLRSWPAYGYSGGAFEILLQCKENSTINLQPAWELINGGRTDTFIMDFVSLPLVNLQILMFHIIQAFSEVYATMELGPLDDDDVMVKLQSEQLIIKFRLKRVDVSLSISYFILDHSEAVVRVTAIAWHDDLRANVREILAENTDYFVLPKTPCKKDIGKNIAKSTQGYILLKNAIDAVMRGISNKIGIVTSNPIRVSILP